MEIIEIKQAKINGENVFFPINYWLNIHNGVIDQNIAIEVEKFNFRFWIDDKKNVIQICYQDDLQTALGIPYVSISDLENLRLKVINTVYVYFYGYLLLPYFLVFSY